MVSLKLSQPGLFGPPQLEDPAAGGIGIWPVQVTVGLPWETVPLEGVAAGAGPGGSTMAKARQTTNRRRTREQNGATVRANPALALENKTRMADSSSLMAL